MDPTRPLRYREHRAPDALAPLVECFWTSRGVVSPGSPPGRVLPDGCSDVLFDLEGSVRVEGDQRPRAWAVGTMRRAMRVTHAGPVDIVAVRFRPGAARAFVPVPAAELSDGWIDAGELWGQEAADLGERLAEADRTADRLALLGRALADRARQGGDPVDALVLRAAALLTGDGGPSGLSGAEGGDPPGSRGAPDVGQVAGRLGCSRRHLERRFLEDVGLSPGELRRVGRLRRAAALIAGSGGTLAEVAARTGYHDQAHMGRDFKKLAGVTPGRYRRELGGRSPRPDGTTGRSARVASVQDGPAARLHLQT